MAQLPNMLQLGRDLRTRLDQTEADLLYTDTSATGVTTAIGDFKKGEKVSNLSYQDFAHRMLHPYVATTNVRLVPNVNGGVFEAGVEVTVSSGTVTWTPGSTQVTNVEVIKTGETIGEVTVSSGASANITFSPALVMSALGSVSLLARVTDNNSQNFINSGNITYTFVYPFYYGILDSSVTIDNPLVDYIRSFTKNISTKGNKVYAFNLSSNKACIAYPGSYGKLTSILDPSGFECLNSFSFKSENIVAADGKTVPYYFYVSAINTATNYKFTFKF